MNLQPNDNIPERLEDAEALQFVADGLTGIRSMAAPVLGSVIVLRGPGWPLATVTAAISSTDRADGWFGGMATELRDGVKSQEGSEADHKADKRMTRWALGGIAIRDLMDGHLGSALFVTTVLGIHAVRDYKMAKVRQEGHENGQDTSAITINRWKTGVTLASVTLAASPPAANRGGRLLRNAGLAAGAALGTVGYFEFKSRLQQEHNDSPQ